MTVMRTDAGFLGWRRWRTWVLATCTVWLIVQNLGLALLLLMGRPAEALGATVAVARTAFSVGTQLFVIAAASALGLALAAWLVHGGGSDRTTAKAEVDDER